MRYLAIIVLVIAGMSELILRASIVLCTLFLVFAADEDFMKPVSFEFARKLIEQESTNPKQIEALVRDNEKLKREKRELQELLVHSDAAAKYIAPKSASTKPDLRLPNVDDLIA